MALFGRGTLSIRRRYDGVCTDYEAMLLPAIIYASMIGLNMYRESVCGPHSPLRLMLSVLSFSCSIVLQINWSSF